MYLLRLSRSRFRGRFKSIAALDARHAQRVRRTTQMAVRTAGRTFLRELFSPLPTLRRFRDSGRGRSATWPPGGHLADNERVTCPLCGLRKARRLCPALAKSICSVCCGAKRLTEIRCPSTCVYLAIAKEHPSASALRQRRDDTTRLVHATRDLSERQSCAFLALVRFLGAYQGPELQPLADQDLAQAAGALASTLETASRGVIYEHRPELAGAARLLVALKPLLAEMNQPPVPGFDREVAVVLRRFEELARPAANDPPHTRRTIDLLSRTLARIAETSPAGEASQSSEPRLIVP